MSRRPTGPQGNICRKTGKKGWLTRAEAEDALRVTQYSLSHAGAERVPQSFYLCPKCKRWHLTGITQDEYRERREEHRRKWSTKAWRGGRRETALSGEGSE